MATRKPDAVKKALVENLILSKSGSTLQQHEKAFCEHPKLYLKCMLAHIGDGRKTIASSTRVRAAAMCWRAQRHQQVCRQALDKIMDSMNVGEVLSMIKLLDTERKLRQIDKKLSKVTKKHKVARYQAEKKALEEGKMSMPGANAGATKSLMKRVKKWVRKIPTNKLEFYLIQFPMELWRELADYAHLHPHDFQLYYFLNVAFGQPAPEFSLVGQIKQLQNGSSADPSEALLRILEQFPTLSECYSFLRTQFDGKSLSDDLKIVLANTAPLVEVIWWFEELECKGVADIIASRLKNGEPLVDVSGKNRESFGKLMERLLMFSKRGKNCAGIVSQLTGIVDQKLAEIKIPTTKQVAVFGDASASMQVAVEAATIIASVVCSCLHAELSFFKNSIVFPTAGRHPSCVSDVMKVCKEIRANGGTSPAACMNYYLKQKQKIDVFIVVTDEEENIDANGAWFSTRARNRSEVQGSFVQCFARYLDKVNPNATVIFVSFLAPNRAGQMVEDFKSVGLEEKCHQFCFSPQRPDLSRLDALIKMLAIEAGQVNEEVVAELDEACTFTDNTNADPGDNDKCGTTVPVICKDGTIQVTEKQSKMIQQAFVDTTEISAQVLQQVIGALRDVSLPPVDSDSVSGWSIISDRTCKN